MKTSFRIAVLLACAAWSSARADGTEPLPDSDALSDNRMKTLMYDESDVYTITTKPGYETNIVFSSDEEIQTISVGDRSLWQLIPAGHRLFIRPMDAGLITNMTVLTNKHSYQFDLKSVGEKMSGVIYVARFTYPCPGIKAGSPCAARPAPTLAPVPAAASVSNPAPVAMAAAQPAPPRTYLNYEYTYSGPDNLAPMEVYDDGKSTFIRYADAAQSLPDIYVVEAGGKEKHVGYNLTGDTLTVSQVAGEIELKQSNGTVYLYNEMLNPK